MAEQLDVVYSTLVDWRKRRNTMRKEKQNVSSEPLTEREKQLMKEIAELKEANEILKDANEILKDAMSFFVKDWRFVQYYNRTRICTFNEGGYPPVVYREKVAADELKAVA